MKRLMVYGIGGAIFGVGLAWSGMAQPEVVLDFLLLRDFGLLLVMGTALLVALPIYQVVSRPMIADRVEPFRARVDRRTWFGSVLFGVGWGLSGVCPGAAFAGLGTGNGPVGVAILAMFVGAYVQGRWLERWGGVESDLGSECAASTSHESSQ